MEGPKSPVSDVGHVSAEENENISHVMSEESSNSRTSKSNRLAARLQQRLNQQRTQKQRQPGADLGAPLSPTRSEPGPSPTREAKSDMPDSNKPSAKSDMPESNKPSVSPTNDGNADETKDSTEYKVHLVNVSSRPRPKERSQSTPRMASPKPTVTTNTPRSSSSGPDPSPKATLSESTGPVKPSKSESSAGHKTSRVPGGAAAKLMLLGPKLSDDESEANADYRTLSSKPSMDSFAPEIQEKALEEIDSAKERAKSEFSSGKSAAPFFQASEAEKQVASAALFDRKEVFHATASASVSALLSPKRKNSNLEQSDIQSVASSGAPGGPSSDVPSVFPAPSLTVANSAFQTPRSMGGEGQEAGKFESLSRQDVDSRLISQDTEKRVEKLQETMRDPDKTLAELLTSIHTPDDFHADIGFTVRRKNACGALQVMTAQANNRVAIAWTVGVLPALTSVLRDTGDQGTHTSFPEKRHRVEFEAARNRAIACLMNLCMPQQNRIAIFHTPSLVHWLLVVINEGHGIPRKGACAVLAYLGKTVENRLLLVQVPGMLDALNKVLKPRPPRVERQEKAPPKAEQKSDDYVSEDEDSHDGSATNTHSENQSTHRSGADSRAITSIPSSYSNDSAATPRFSGANSPVEIRGYDETADEQLRAARQNVFALVLHLVKEKDNAYHLARHDDLMATLAAIADHQDSPSHLLAIKTVAFLTRHRLNTKVLVFKQRDIVPAIVHGTSSANSDSRLYSCYALQNLAQDKSCRQELAVSPNLISALCDRSRKAQSEDERLAAISAIKNLCDEPANLIPMTNTPDCVATLMHLAHGMEEGITDLMQYRACDALATLSHWLRKIATSGQALENARNKQRPPKTLFVPSLQVVPFNQWK